MSISIITTKRRVRDFLVYDMEWVPGTLDLRMVGVYDGQTYRCYRTVGAFLAGELTHSTRGKWFYAHFGGIADVQFIIHEICAGLRILGFKVKAAFSGSSAIIVHVSRGKNSWHLVDSGRLLPDRLANIAKAIGMQKGGEGFPDPDEDGISDDEYERRREAMREWYASVAFDILRSYNENDCVILWTAIAEFQSAVLELGGQLQMTLASCGMYLFRRKYLKQSIETSPLVNEIARMSYTASRVEVHQTHVSNANYYDINSSFPHAMTFPLPGNYIESHCGDLPDDSKLYIADCEIEVPEARITPVPIRIDGRIFFPSGKWRAWLTDVDIKLLLREGGKVNCYEALIFEPQTDLADYATDLYRKKEAADVAGNEFERLVYKLFMNCLYGKFAESNVKQGLRIDPDEIDSGRMEMLLPGLWLEERIVPVPNVHVPLSSHITAIARRTLFDLLCSCAETHYCDTDGFSTTETLSTGDGLGNLKLEKRIRKGRFVAPKVYTLDGEIQKKDGTWKEKSLFKGKGFSRLSASRFARVLEGEAITFERMARLKEVLRKGGSKPYEIRVEKQLRMKNMNDDDFDADKNLIPKRFTYPDGHTRPWKMEELREIL